MPLMRTTEVLPKPVPFTVIVKAGPPVTADVGLTLVSVGARAFDRDCARRVNRVQMRIPRL